jgi:hypothetical protein
VPQPRRPETSAASIEIARLVADSAPQGAAAKNAHRKKSVYPQLDHLTQEKRNAAPLRPEAVDHHKNNINLCDLCDLVVNYLPCDT